MAKKILQSAKVAAPGGIMSQGVEVPPGKMVFVSGQVARDLDGSVVGVGDVTAQTRKVLQNMQAVLAESGATMDDVVKVTVFVTNLEKTISGIHKVREASTRSAPANGTAAHPIIGGGSPLRAI